MGVGSWKWEEDLVETQWELETHHIDNNKAYIHVFTL